jgi:hypothetical protein
MKSNAEAIRHAQEDIPLIALRVHFASCVRVAAARSIPPLIAFGVRSYDHQLAPKLSVPINFAPLSINALPSGLVGTTQTANSVLSFFGTGALCSFT